MRAKKSGAAKRNCFSSVWLQVNAYLLCSKSCRRGDRTCFFGSEGKYGRTCTARARTALTPDGRRGQRKALGVCGRRYSLLSPSTSGTLNALCMHRTVPASRRFVCELNAPPSMRRTVPHAPLTHACTHWNRRSTSCLNQFGDLLAQLSLVGSAHRVYDVAALVKQEGRHARDSQLSRKPTKLVHVHLHKAPVSMSPPIPARPPVC